MPTAPTGGVRHGTSALIDRAERESVGAVSPPRPRRRAEAARSAAPFSSFGRGAGRSGALRFDPRAALIYNVAGASGQARDGVLELVGAGSASTRTGHPARGDPDGPLLTGSAAIGSRSGMTQAVPTSSPARSDSQGLALAPRARGAGTDVDSATAAMSSRHRHAVTSSSIVRHAGATPHPLDTVSSDAGGRFPSGATSRVEIIATTARSRSWLYRGRRIGASSTPRGGGSCTAAYPGRRQVRRAMRLHGRRTAPHGASGLCHAACRSLHAILVRSICRAEQLLAPRAPARQGRPARCRPA